MASPNDVFPPVVVLPPPPVVLPPVTVPPPEPKEDEAGGEGEAIDTFSTYIPSALPLNLLNALRNTDASTTDKSGDVISCIDNRVEKQQEAALHENHEVIEMLDSSDDEEKVDSNHKRLSNKSTENAISVPSTEDPPTSEIFEKNLIQDPPLTSECFDKNSGNNIPSHSFPACESALLASVAAPTASQDSARCLLDLAKTKALSPLQLEGVALAITRHQRIFISANKTFRAGFFLGDGAGVGKGRQIAAVLADSLFRGRTRHLWISTSHDLHVDAQRDLAAVHCINCPIYGANDVLENNKKLHGSTKKGILFVTYSMLVSGQGKRMEEIISWVATGSNKHSDTAQQKQAVEREFSGLVVFDEAHKAKNLLQADTQTAQRVFELQHRLPMARVLYCSATGVSDLSHFAYAHRLGLWGPGSTVYPTFESFSQALANNSNNNSLASLELLACEMKQSGMFVARSLSWEGAEFETLHVPLSLSQRCEYDQAVQWWTWAYHEIHHALHNVLNIKSQRSPTTNVWRSYWSAHLRFFREMNVCAKIQTIAEQAKKYIENGHAIVIGLQSTGEASTQAGLEDWGEEQNILLQSSNSANAGAKIGSDTKRATTADDLLLPSLLSTARCVMISFIKNHFPVAYPPPAEPFVPPMPPDGFTSEAQRAEYLKLHAEAEYIKSLPPPPPIPALMERRRLLLEKARQLALPPNPLDDVIERLGGTNHVAELTGRSVRIVRYPKSRQQKLYHLEKRIGPPSNKKSYGLSMPTVNEEQCDRLNIREKKKFMDGTKNVAIISDAASTGISLHAAEGSSAAHKRRVHFTIELPWAPDKAIQQLGRSHRSGQRSAPIYKMVVTELGGERRFGAAVAKRMANLGALTKGDRRAATGSDLSEFDIDSIYGRRALGRFYLCVRDCEAKNITSPSRHSNEILDKYIEDLREANLIPYDFQGRHETDNRAFALRVARKAVFDVGLGANESTKKSAEVRVFLNRIAGLPVLKQNLVFSLFHSTLQDIIQDARAKGEYEGNVEAVKATSIELEGAPEVIAVDGRSGAETKLMHLVVDRGISLEKGLEMSEELDYQAISNKKLSIKNRGAETGFYVSKRQIAGRSLVLFAKRKVEPTNDDEDQHDPLRLTIITRPNTGTNPCEMSSTDLKFKYRLIVSSIEIHEMLQQKDEARNGGEPMGKKADIVRSQYPQLAKLWDGAYRDSDVFEYTSGLAPRKSHLGLATGAVLHVLPMLEEAVAAELLAADRALRVVRIELTSTGERFVGIRFPLKNEPIQKLKTLTSGVMEARKSRCLSGPEKPFLDEDFDAVNEKTMAWATKEPMTMKSFFQAAPTRPTTLSGTKRKSVSSNNLVSPSPANYDVPVVSKESRNDQLCQKNRNRKAPTSIKSFFSKK